MNSAESKEQESNSIHKELLNAAEKLMLSRRRKVLLVEDTAAHAALIRRAIDEKTWNIEHVTRARDALVSFEQDPWRIVLLDLSLPDTKGTQLLGRLKNINSQASVIVITATDNLYMGIESMQKGAYDYVVKSDPEILEKKISRIIERALQANIKSAEQYLIDQSKIVELVQSERIHAIDTLLRTLCHEVNNPLSGVMALTQLLKQHDQADDDIKRLAENIISSAKEVAEVVEKLRDISDTVTEFGGQEVLGFTSSSSKIEDAI